ncbi:MAG: hypothetical protein RLN69_08160 [Woeseiaceae bacterium]
MAVATRPFDFGVEVFFRLGDRLADFFATAGFLTAALLLLVDFLRPGDFLATFFLLEGFFFVAGFLLDAFLFAAFFLLATFFFPVGFLRAATFLEDFFLDDFFLLTLDFFPDGFFLDDDLLDAAFLREAADVARFLVEAFLAAIFCSCRSEKNAGLYIDCRYMEARKQGFFGQFGPGGN